MLSERIGVVPKNIVIRCDGSGNEIESRLSNVLKLFHVLQYAPRLKRERLDELLVARVVDPLANEPPSEVWEDYGAGGRPIDHAAGGAAAPTPPSTNATAGAGRIR
jgi:hypothetical protein